MLTLKKIKAEIDRWDPMDLLPDAPIDEYMLEVKEIFRRAQKLHTDDAKGLAKIIHEVFVEYFDGIYTEEFKPEDSLKVAEAILRPKHGEMNI